jgi:hypothetical protein
MAHQSGRTRNASLVDEHCSLELQLMLRLGFDTGMRLGSICDLKVRTLSNAIPDPCRAKDVFDFIVNPYGSMQDEGWKSATSLAGMFIGQSAVTRICRNLREQSGFTPIWIDDAFTALKTTSEIGVLTADLSAVCMDLPHSPVTDMLIKGAVFENYSLVFSENTENFGKLTFSDCLFESIEIDSQGQGDSLPVFQGCVFMLVKGRSGPEDLPAGRFDSNCSFEEFSDSAQTQSSILNSSLTKGEKLVLTVLRKLFVQSLSGRAESALYRGLDLNDRQLFRM